MSKLADFSLRSYSFKSKKYNFAELKRNKKHTILGYYHRFIKSIALKK